MKPLLFILLITFCSCQSFSKSEKPESFYGDDKMAKIMADLYLYDGVISSNRTALRKDGILATDYIYKKYNTDSMIYAQNFNYYADREEEYLILIEKVQSILEQEKDSVEKRQESIQSEFKSTPYTDSLPEKKKKHQDLL